MAEIRVNATGGLKLYDADDSHYAQIIAGTITSNVDVLTLGHASADFNIPVKVLGTTPTLTIGDAGAEDTKIVFDGNAQDFYIGLDDSADDLVIGLGSTVGTTPSISINEDRDVTISDGAIDFDIASHDTSNGLKLGGTLVTATAAELNIMDGVTTTAAEINLIDGGTARGTTAIVDADGVLINDAGTMRMTTAATLKTYIGGFDVSSITGATALATQPASDDEIVISDAGTLKRVDIKHIQNTPAFYADLSANISIATGTYVKVAFDNEIFDSDGTYDNSSNYRFTPGVAGKYYIGAKHRLDTSTDGTATILAIYKNGSVFNRSRFTLDNSEEYFFACVLDLDDDDYVEIYGYQNSGTTTNIGGGSDSTIAFMFGYRLAGL